MDASGGAKSDWGRALQGAVDLFTLIAVLVLVIGLAVGAGRPSLRSTEIFVLLTWARVLVLGLRR